MFFVNFPLHMTMLGVTVRGEPMLGTISSFLNVMALQIFSWGLCSDSSRFIICCHRNGFMHAVFMTSRHWSRSVRGVLVQATSSSGSSRRGKLLLFQDFSLLCNHVLFCLIPVGLLVVTVPPLIFNIFSRGKINKWKSWNLFFCNCLTFQ